MRVFYPRPVCSRFLARGLVTVFLAAAMSGCSWLGEKPDITKDWSAARLYSAAKERLENKDYEKAIEYYEKLDHRPCPRVSQHCLRSHRNSILQCACSSSASPPNSKARFRR